MTQSPSPQDIATAAQSIRAAYAQLTGPGTWVKLSRIRPLVGADRELVDAALLALNLDRDVSIEPESDQKTLTEADRAAAVWMGNEWKHVMIVD
jgi:hypothetical protein